MNEWTVFLTLGTILAFVGTMYSMFYKPTHELKIEIVKLTSELIATRKDNEVQDKRIGKNEERLDKHEHRLYILEYKKQYTDEDGL